MLVKMVNGIFSELREVLSRVLVTVKLQKKYPTCRFYSGAIVDEKSSLGRYNVIFRNTSIVDSTIGDHTFVQHDSHIHHADIGKFCSIAPGVIVGLGRHPIGFVSTHPAFYSVSQPIVKSYADKDTFEPFKRTKIGHDVWLGQNALIADGVTIGTGAIVAAGSIVTKDVPAYVIVAGVPAKIVKYRFTKAQIEHFLKSQWWDMQENWLQENCKLFSDVVLFLESIADHRIK